jgi:hypothetical protein
MENLNIFGLMHMIENPTWPPRNGDIIVVKSPHYQNLFVGKVLNTVWNNSASAILLLNNKEYIESAISEKELHIISPSLTSSKGLFLVMPTYAWKYVDDNMMSLLINAKSPNVTVDVNNSVQTKYDTYVKTINPNDKLVHGDKPAIVSTGDNGERLSVNPPISQNDLANEAIYTDPTKDKGTSCKTDDSFKEHSLLDDKGDLDLNDLMREKEVNTVLQDVANPFTPPEDFVRKILLEKLDPKNSTVITEEEQKIIVNKTVAVRNMISSKEDEINEGKKIIAWLMENIVDKETDGNKVFGDMKMSIFNGYVHIARKGIAVEDTVTKDLIHDLQHFTWQYGIPINYDTLKFTLFQNKLQREMKRSSSEQKEADQILSLEYLIALQPEPRFQIWTLKRLIMAWYADVDLQNNIRKIKVLINQWRARADQDFNKKNSILPSIVVYPRYGKKSAKIVMSSLVKYFALYQNIGWSCSTPSYFVKMNNLIWYTNGSTDLKLYFREVLKTQEKHKTDPNIIANKTFDTNYSKVNGAKDLMFMK